MQRMEEERKKEEEMKREEQEKLKTPQKGKGKTANRANRAPSRVKSRTGDMSVREDPSSGINNNKNKPIIIIKL